MSVLLFLLETFKLSRGLFPSFLKIADFAFKATSFRTCALHLFKHMSKLLFKLLQIARDTLLFKSFLITITAQVL
ncbi:hypothetical protein D3C76_1742640 [compost metagenome]